MTTIQISLHDGTQIEVSIENYNSVELTNMLNSNQLIVVNIGGIIVNKNAVKMIVPLTTAATTV